MWIWCRLNGKFKTTTQLKCANTDFLISNSPGGRSGTYIQQTHLFCRLKLYGAYRMSRRLAKSVQKTNSRHLNMKLHDADACLYMDRWTYGKCVEMRCVASIFAQSLAHIDKAAVVAVGGYAVRVWRRGGRREKWWASEKLKNSVVFTFTTRQQQQPKCVSSIKTTHLHAI